MTDSKVAECGSEALGKLERAPSSLTVDILGNDGQEAIFKHLSWKNTKMAVLLVCFVLYFVLAIAIYMPGEDWGAGDCIYYAVVVVTTVGYGDYLPSSQGLKIATVFFVHFGLSIVVLILGIAQDIIMQISAKHMHTKSLGLFDTKGHLRQKRKNVIITLTLYLSFLLFGTLYFGVAMFKGQDGHDPDTHWLVDGLYYTVITISTVGFGDHSPQTDQTKVVGCFFMLVGIPICASTFGMINGLIYEGPSEPIELEKIKGELTQDKLEDMEGFVKDLRKQGVGNYGNQGENNISRFEFFAFMLCRNGVIEQANIESLMKNFDRLDKNGEGIINQDDVRKQSSEENVALETAEGIALEIGA